METGSNPQVRDLLKCLLAADGYSLTGEQIIEDLWPDRDPDWARDRLRDTLSKLRRALEPDRPAYARSAYLVNDRQAVGLIVAQDGEDTAGAWIDCVQFERLAEASLAATTPIREARRMAEEALALYAGPFLPQDRYSDWIERPRRRYHRLWADLVRREARAEIVDQHYERAVRLVSRLIDAMPDDEEAVVVSMLAHLGAGLRSEALRVYGELCVHLKMTLGSAPSPKIQALRDALCEGASIDQIVSSFA